MVIFIHNVLVSAVLLTFLKERNYLSEKASPRPLLHPEQLTLHDIRRQKLKPPPYIDFWDDLSEI